MKFTNIIFTTLLAVASVECGIIGHKPAPGTSYHGYCLEAGEVCTKLKRAAEAAAEAIAGPQSCHGFCYEAGEVCSKAKRDALALAEATAEAYAAADPDARPCHAPGAPCSKAKREALLACRNAPPPPTTPAYGSQPKVCWQAGETCSKLKRAAEAVAEAIAQPNQDPSAGSVSWQGSCSPADFSCSKQKRALNDVSSLLDKILLR